MSLTKCTPTLVVEWTCKHGAKDELILSCTEHIGPNEEFKLSSLCVFMCSYMCPCTAKYEFILRPEYVPCLQLHL